MRIASLSQIQSAPVSTPRYNVGQVASLESARASGAQQVANQLTEGVSRLNEGARIRGMNQQQEFADYRVAKQEEYDLAIQGQQEQATSKLAGDIRSIERDLASRDFFTPDEIPDGLDVRTVETIVDKDGNLVEIPRQQIPSYEVAPELFRTRSRALVEAYGENITDGDVQSKWKASMLENMDRAYHQVEMNAIESQKNELRQLNTQNIADALDNRNYDVAFGLADSNVFSDAEKAGLRGDIRTRLEMDTYDASMSEADLPSLRQHLSELTNAEYNKDLNESQRLAYVHKIGSMIGQLESQGQADYSVEFSRLRRDIDRQTDAIFNGDDVNVDNLIGLMERAESAYNLEPNSMALSRDKIFEAVSWLPEISQFSRMNDLQRSQILRGMTSGGMDEKQSYKANKFRQLDANISRRISDDVVSLGHDVGLTRADPMPQLEEPQEFMQWLGARQRGNDLLTQQYGVGGFLTNEERDVIANSMEMMTNEERLYTMSLVSESLGFAAPEFWNHFTDSAGGVYSVAGSVFQEAPAVSRAILEGLEFKTSGNYNPPPRIDMQMQQSRLIGQAYGIDSQRSAIVQSVDAMYAQMSKLEGEYDASVFNLRRYENAVNAVTGGLVDFGDYKVLPPVRGMEKRDFDRYIRDVSTSWLESQGGVQGYQGQYEDLRQDIRSGRVRMVNVGPNEYLLRSEINGVDAFLLKSNSTQPFLFKYDPDATSVTRGMFGGLQEEPDAPTNSGVQ
jgi:hypothetical protein